MKYPTPGLWLMTFVVLVASVINNCNHPIHVQAVEAPVPEASVAPPPAPPPPICINQNCYQRPKFLECVYTSTTAYSAQYCVRWEIQYEHHCDCDRWAPAVTP